VHLFLGENSKMKQVIIITGIDGSGRTSLARQLANKVSHLGEAIICSTDDFYMGSGEYRFDSGLLPKASAQCFKKFISALTGTGIYSNRKISVIIIDNANIGLEDISPYMLAAQSFDCKAEVIEIKCDTRLGMDRTLKKSSFNTISMQNTKLSQRNIPPHWNYRVINAARTRTTTVSSSRYTFIDNELSKQFKAG
jgi:tRNA uridine 5-carbamoylmethylation protein Kti12